MATKLERAKQDLKVAELATKQAIQEAEQAYYDRYKQHVNSNVATTRLRPSGWTTPADAERDFSTVDRRKAMAKCRQVVEETPIGIGIIQNLLDNEVGSGFSLSMTTKDKGFNEEVEAMWKTDRDHLDIRNVRPWGSLQRCWQARKKVDGDVGIALVDGGRMDDGRVQSYVQTFEADLISHGKDVYGSKKDTGIDFGPFMRPKRYWVVPRVKADGSPDARYKAKGFDPQYFVHYAHFPHERVTRARGVPVLLQSLNAISDLQMIIGLMLQKVKNETFIGLKFHKDPVPSGYMFGPSVETNKNAEDGKKRRHVKMLPGINLHLTDGEDASVLETKSPNSEWIPLVKTIVRYIGMTVGMPLEMILMDFTETNYSSARAALEMAKKRFRVEQNNLCFVSSRVFQWWLSRQVKHNGLVVPGSIEASFWSHRWGKPGWPYINPQQEASAHALQVERGLKSRRQILEETGGDDIDELVRQLADEWGLIKNAFPIAYGVGRKNILNAGDVLTVDGKPVSAPLPPEDDNDNSNKEDDDESTK